MVAHVKLNLAAGYGSSTVEVNGVDLSNDCAGVSLQKTAGRPDSIVTLYLHANVELDGDLDGVVVERPSRGTPVEALKDLLASVDPAVLEQQALSKLGLSGEVDSPTQAILLTLKEWAEELDG